MMADVGPVDGTKAQMSLQSKAFVSNTVSIIVAGNRAVKGSTNRSDNHSTCTLQDY